MSESQKKSKPEPFYTPGPHPKSVRDHRGQVWEVPPGWVLLPPGDPALTRRAKAMGEYWLVKVPQGRRLISLGIWTSSQNVEQIKVDLEQERSTEQFAKKKVAAAQRREKVQLEYVEDFQGAILTFLDFHPHHAELAQRFAKAVADHATPVGSGTVARTKRIPIESRAAAAVIAWMRHQTTGYDSMKIPRVAGKRREVRRLLAQRSQELLWQYRQSNGVSKTCPLLKALNASNADAPLPSDSTSFVSRTSQSNEREK
jgi:hypothetical protein